MTKMTNVARLYFRIQTITTEAFQSRKNVHKTEGVQLDS